MKVETPKAFASLDVLLEVMPSLASITVLSAAQEMIGIWIAVCETGLADVRKAGLEKKGLGIGTYFTSAMSSITLNKVSKTKGRKKSLFLIA